VTFLFVKVSEEFKQISIVADALYMKKFRSMTPCVYSKYFPSKNTFPCKQVHNTVVVLSDIIISSQSAPVFFVRLSFSFFIVCGKRCIYDLKCKFAFFT